MHGAGTGFLAEVSVGDALQISQPLSGRLEVRVVKMVLSDRSAGINAPFSLDLVAATPFFVLKLPRAAEDPAAVAAAAAAKRRVDEAAAFGTYASDGGTKATYKVKAGLSYKIKTETVAGGGATREALLDLRTKHKGDKVREGGGRGGGSEVSEGWGHVEVWCACVCACAPSCRPSTPPPTPTPFQYC